VIKRSSTLIAAFAAFVLMLSACGVEDEGGPVAIARANWDSGYMQAAIYAQLIEELGHEVTDPAASTLSPYSFYPALAAGQYDLWANGWFPLHDIYLEGENVTGQAVDLPIEPVGWQVAEGATDGLMIDKATADSMGINSMDGVAANASLFDNNGDGKADLIGCNVGWGCETAINEQIANESWGAGVEQISGVYNDLAEGVVAKVAAGEPALFYAWTPNWTNTVLVAGDNAVWLQSNVNDIRAVANTDFLDANPAIQRLLEVVAIPLGDIAAQNAKMVAGDYTEADVEADAQAWIANNRDKVDNWLATARAAG
jgi:glycine betaine/proline transport system substrate-binding protein